MAASTLGQQREAPVDDLVSGEARVHLVGSGLTFRKGGPTGACGLRDRERTFSEPLKCC